ncbi:hypothetical protein F1C10_11135 [Sphingomonas sp. NBWT7]|uniref:hypothetical protein n=1 Tax=Sphingomonas sp. NBWT7 TaxID=2596913 RepID=UPI0018617EB9|nr:hypothetical protein [Sphingomonas sp. NBWT7]QNE32443.1 hypothetical protein F1C10_11135 [Sphingomonas sp. NBWT7]
MRPPQPAGIVARVRAQEGRAQQALNRSGETLTVWAIWMLLLASAVAEALGQTQLFGFGFYTLHIVDPPVLLAFFAWAFCQIERAPRGGLVAVLALVIAALVLMNFVRGMISDAAPALLWARANLANAALLLLATTCNLSNRVQGSFCRALIVSGGAVAVLTLLRLILGPGLFMLNPADADMINDGGRALSSSGAFLISLAAVLLLSDVLRTGVTRATGKAALLMAYVAMEVASRQGTATVALAAMLGVVLVTERGSLRGARAALGIGLLLMLPLLGLLAFDPDQLRSAQGGTFEIAHRVDNLDTRSTIWAALKVGFSQQSLFDQLFGMPAGQLPPMIVYLSNQLGEWRLAIHSMYYGSLPVMGYVGLSAFITLLFTLSAGSLLSVLPGRGRGSPPAYPLAMCVGTALLSYTYEIRLASMMGLFIAIWWFREARSSARRVRPPHAASEASTTSSPVSRAASAPPEQPLSRRRTAPPSPQS